MAKKNMHIARCPLLGMKWKDIYMIQQRGVKFLWHYLDNWVGLTVECAKESCKLTGMPIEWEKVEGPATTINFLGMELDTGWMQIRLPAL